MINDPLHHIEQITKETNRAMGIRARSVFNRYPVTFSFLVLLGVIFVLHGFDELIKEIPYLNTHPAVLLLIGLIILILTGTLYKRLDKKLE